MEKDTLYIYMLVDPHNDLPFYVGRSFHPQIRYKEHISMARSYMKNGWVNGNEKKCQVIMGLISNNEYPIMTILDECFLHSKMRQKTGVTGVMDNLETYWAILIKEQYGCELCGGHSGSITRKIPIGLGIEQTKYHLQNGERSYHQKKREVWKDIFDNAAKRINQELKMREFAKFIGTEWFFDG